MKVEREQTGVRLEKTMLKTLKSVASYYDLGLGDLIEIMTIYTFNGKSAFSETDLKVINQLKETFGMNYGIEAEFLSDKQKKFIEQKI